MFMYMAVIDDTIERHLLCIVLHEPRRETPKLLRWSIAEGWPGTTNENMSAHWLERWLIATKQFIRRLRDA
jgi:hypothetical protein